MITHTSLENDQFLIHQSDLTSTKAFTHGTWVFTKETVAIGKFSAVPLPAGFTPTNKMVLDARLVGADGNIREKKVRVGSTILLFDEKAGVWRAAGLAKTPSRYSAADGWAPKIWNFRAYFTHQGVETDRKLPEWIKDSVARQRAFWNKLAWLCREAKRACATVPEEELKALVADVILPAIDKMNDSLGRKQAKLKMKHPKKLKGEFPSNDAMWRFIGELRHRIEEEKPVPEGLLDQVLAFADKYPANYTPINEFQRDFAAIAAYEAKHVHLNKDDKTTVELRSWEQAPITKRFEAVLKARRTRACAFTDGWPYIKYPDMPRYEDWGIEYYFNEAGVDASDLEEGKTVRCLTFGPPLDPKKTGHPKMESPRRTQRCIRQAVIDMRGETGERWRFAFAVLQHRKFPEGAHLKKWSLIEKNGKLQLSLLVEAQSNPLPEQPNVKSAGLDIGWRMMPGNSLRFGVLYEDKKETFRELRFNLTTPPSGTENHRPFNIDFGATRWDVRNINTLLPDWDKDDPLPTAFNMRAILAKRRSDMLNETKSKLAEHLGEETPTWWPKVGRKGLCKMMVEPVDNGEKKEQFTLYGDPKAESILRAWNKKDAELGILFSKYCDRMTKRMDNEHHAVAYDICAYLKRQGINCLRIESNFMAQVAGVKDNNASEALKASQKYRQFVGLAKFIITLKQVAGKEGIIVQECEASNTSRIHYACGTLNVGTEDINFICAGCGEEIDQDKNAAVNLSRSQPAKPKDDSKDKENEASDSERAA